MNHSDFKIGLHFYTGSGEWVCTDVGTRTIVAYKYHHEKEEEEWYKGPPFAVKEIVLDEYDIGGCSLDPKDFNSN